MNKKNSLKDKSYSSLSDHKRYRKCLIPPFLQLQGLELTSWVNHRLSEMIWACLIIAHSDRETALLHFRNIVNFFSELPEHDQPKDLTLSAIARLTPEVIEAFLEELFFDDDLRYILSPLMLFPDLPGRIHWVKYASSSSDSERWNLLKYAVLRCYDHQSQEATDCRWLRVLYPLIAGKLICDLHPLKEEIIYYPNFGDMRGVRPAIRSMEGVFNNLNDELETNEWNNHFWQVCLENTSCEKMRDHMENKLTQPILDVKKVEDIHHQLVNHCNQCRPTSGLDAKYDTVFGISLYCLKMFQEIIEHEMNTSIVGRLYLRSLVECFITLRYLCKNDNPALWLAYRKYGAGQAKLTMLKFDEIGSCPHYVNYDVLNLNANQDCWQEFVPINIGNWENTNLRVMSEKTDTKREYDMYYSWTSGFVHGMWGAINESVYDICANPLHRFHSIPKSEAAELNDVITDVVYLVNKILDDVDQMYPSFKLRF